MLGFTDRLARVGERGQPARDVVNTITVCRTKSPAVVGALAQRVDLPPAVRRALYSRLAAVHPEPAEAGSYADYRREGRFADALLDAAGQAVGLGLVREAKLIIGHVADLSFRAYQLTDPWPLSGGRVARHLKRVAIVAAGRRRASHITDVLPDDMVAAVPLSVRRRGPVAFERRLRQLLTAPKRERAKRVKSRLDGEEAQRWERLLSHRLPSLVPFIDQIVAILTAKNPAEPIEAALQAATAAMAQASNYPYRDQVSFLRHVFLDVIRWAAACRAPLDKASGENLAAFLEQSQSPVVADWLQTVALLARSPATQACALRLARLAEFVIAEDTNVSEQIRCYGALARALLPISPEELRPYFRIGLELADAVGSDDQERIGDFISFVAQYSGEPLAPETVHQFVRLCELNIPGEPEALDWRSFANALAAIAGAAGLAPIARLADREKIDLGWTLPPMLKALVVRDRLNPTLAAGMFGLAPFQSTWNWFPSDAAKATLPRLAEPMREGFGQVLLTELDRDEATQIHSETLKGFKDLFDAELAPESPSRARIVALHVQGEKRDGSAASPPTQDKPVVPKGLFSASAISPDELRAAIEELAAKIGGHRPTDGFILQGFVSETSNPAPRAALLATVVNDEQLRFQDKVSFLEEAQRGWRGQSRALDAQLDTAALSVALRHLDEVVRSGDSWRRPLSRIARLAGEQENALVAAVLKALPGHNLDMSSDFWMACAIALAKSASAAAIGDALSRYALHSTASLPDTIGDGAWSKVFAAEGGTDGLSADLLWMRLGAPDAADRWRAAHAIRRLVTWGEAKILDRLMRNLERTSAGAFQDQSLPFFHLHARLWLLIAVARIAPDIPDEVVPFRPILEECASSEEFPHVLCRHFAIEALQALARQGRIADPDFYRRLVKDFESSRSSC